MPCRSSGQGVPLEQHDVGPAALREVVGGGRAYYSAANYYTLRLFWHRAAEASGVHAPQCSQCSVHDAAGWVGRLSAESLTQLQQEL